MRCPDIKRRHRWWSRLSPLAHCPAAAAPYRTRSGIPVHVLGNPAMQLAAQQLVAQRLVQQQLMAQGQARPGGAVPMLPQQMLALQQAQQAALQQRLAAAAAAAPPAAAKKGGGTRKRGARAAAAAAPSAAAMFAAAAAQQPVRGANPYADPGGDRSSASVWGFAAVLAHTAGVLSLPLKPALLPCRSSSPACQARWCGPRWALTPGGPPRRSTRRCCAGGPVGGCLRVYLSCAAWQVWLLTALVPAFTHPPTIRPLLTHPPTHPPAARPVVPS